MATGNGAQQGKSYGPGGRTIRNIYLLVPILAMIVVIQATLLVRIRFLGVSPNLMLAVVVAWGLLRGIEAGIVWGFVGGLVFDLIAGAPLGMSSLALMTICFLTGLGESNLFQGNIFLPVIVVTLATPLYGWMILSAQQLRGLHVDWPNVTLYVILPELLLNGTLVILVYPALRWLAQQLGSERLDW
jgi:rod shape-determining protein MreD